MQSQIQILTQTKTSVKVIDQEDQYQLLLPKKNLSKNKLKNILEDMIDSVEWSSEEEHQEDDQLINNANTNNSWVSLKDMRKEVGL